jgi:pimeloyl-ACP methyl ester carboxylesterase
MAIATTFFRTVRIRSRTLLDAPALGFKFKLPVFLIHGSEDHIADSSSAANYFKDIQAPIKRMTQIEGAGHFVPTTHTEQIVEAIRQDMRLVPSLRE